MEAVPRPQVGCGTGAFWTLGAVVTICIASGARQVACASGTGEPHVRPRTWSVVPATSACMPTGAAPEAHTGNRRSFTLCSREGADPRRRVRSPGESTYRGNPCCRRSEVCRRSGACRSATGHRSAGRPGTSYAGTGLDMGLSTVLARTAPLAGERGLYHVRQGAPPRAAVSWLPLIGAWARRDACGVRGL